MGKALAFWRKLISDLIIHRSPFYLFGGLSGDKKGGGTNKKDTNANCLQKRRTF